MVKCRFDGGRGMFADLMGAVASGQLLGWPAGVCVCFCSEAEPGLAAKQRCVGIRGLRPSLAFADSVT